MNPSNTIETDLVLTLPAANDQNGIIIYGHWNKDIEPDVKFPSEIWPEGSQYKEYRELSTNSLPDIGLHNRKEDEPEWTQIRWDIILPSWPISDWKEALKKTLQTLIDAGAAVAWCDLETHPPYPPKVFRDNQSKTCVYAYLTKSGDFNCTAFAGQPFQTVSGKEVTMLADLLYKDRPEWDAFVKNHGMDMTKW